MWADSGPLALRLPPGHCMLRPEKFGRFHADPVSGPFFFVNVSNFSIFDSTVLWIRDTSLAPMQAGYEKLNGIDRDRLFAILEPVLVAHGVEAVEVIWQTDNKGWLLTLTIEKPDTTGPGEGITVDVCAEISRDLAVSLDVEEVIPHKYRLEVGSPGLERALYRIQDYARFAGRDAKLKLREGDSSQIVIRGILRGLDADSKILIDTSDGQRALALETIQSGRLEFNWKKPSAQREKCAANARPRPSDRKSHDCSPQRSK